MPELHTFTFSPATGPKSPALELDVILPSTASHSERLTPLVWFHGGGLIQGNRKAMAGHMRRSADKYRVAVVAIDYRLCPQVRLPDVLHDVALGIKYTIHTLPAALAAKAPTAPQLDTSKILVSGSSAGGWLALLAGLGPAEAAGLLENDRARIAAVAAVYPITDIGVDFFAKPARPFMAPAFPDSMYEKMTHPDDPALPFSAGDYQTEPRYSFYAWAQKSGSFQQLLLTESQRSSGWLDKTSIPKFVNSHVAASSGWPGIYIIHGDADKAVEVTQARNVVQALEQAGHADVQYEELKGIDHLWDLFDESVEIPGMYEFLKVHA